MSISSSILWAMQPDATKIARSFSLNESDVHDCCPYSTGSFPSHSAREKWRILHRQSPSKCQKHSSIHPMPLRTTHTLHAKDTQRKWIMKYNGNCELFNDAKWRKNNECDTSYGIRLYILISSRLFALRSGKTVIYYHQNLHFSLSVLILVLIIVFFFGPPSSALVHLAML